MQLVSIYSECDQRRWIHSNGMVNWCSWSTWKYTLDGPDICFFRSLKYSKYSLRIFVTATKFYGDGDGNPLVLTGPLQPWQTLALLLQRLTTGIRTSLQLTSRIAFIYLCKEAFPVLWIFLSGISLKNTWNLRVEKTKKN